MRDAGGDAVLDSADDVPSRPFRAIAAAAAAAAV